MRLLIISGLSGAGKSICLHTLEDLGFYCIDNLPIDLLPAFMAHVRQSHEAVHARTAVGIDARNGPDDLGSFPARLDELRAQGHQVELIFLDARDEVLLRRFSETRRRHPLTRPDVALAEALALERRLLEPLTAAADLIIDTTTSNVHQLRERVRDAVESRPTRQLALLFVSFGYKFGVPPDVDFVFDLRCLPNPHWELSLRNLTGQAAEVAQFLEADSRSQAMFAELCAFLERWIPCFEAENRSYMTVALGCTGGRHRSVYFIERLARHFRALGKSARVRHRELPCP